MFLDFRLQMDRSTLQRYSSYKYTTHHLQITKLGYFFWGGVLENGVFNLQLFHCQNKKAGHSLLLDIPMLSFFFINLINKLKFVEK